MGNVNHNYSNKKKPTRIRNTVSYITLTHLFRNIIFQRSDVTENQKKKSLFFPVLIYCSNLVVVILHQNRTASALLTNLDLDNY